MFNVLENEIIPLYYDQRASDKMPVGWVAKSKEGIRTLAPQFSMRRMVKEYTESLYLPVMKK
jgi:starch phosphorylase